MSKREEMASLSERWAEEARILRRWGFEGEAGALMTCRSDLTDRLSEEDAQDLRDLTETWETEAEVLREYGHEPEARVIEVCRERLRSARSAPHQRRQEEGAGESGSEAPHEGAAPRSPGTAADTSAHGRPEPSAADRTPADRAD